MTFGCSAKRAAKAEIGHADGRAIGTSDHCIDPSVGRWLSPDPLGCEPGDVNIYRYPSAPGALVEQPNTWDVAQHEAAYRREPSFEAG